MTAYDRDEYVRVAYYYYRQGMTQDEIARKLGTSRVRVNRILARCRELGIVRIQLVGMEDACCDLETELETAYGLENVRVAEAREGEDLYSTVGLLAADYLSRQLRDGDVVGFSRGRTLARMMDHLPRLPQKDLTVTQLMGGWNYHRAAGAANDIVHRFAEQTGAEPSFMYAPVLVHNKKFKDAIWEEPSFLETYRTICRCRVAVVGVGSVSHDPDFLGQDESIRQAYRELLDKGAVGEICAHSFNAQGESVTGAFDHKAIAVELADYLRIPLRIGVACGPDKLPAVLGAVRGGYLNALVTDKATAEALAAAAPKPEPEPAASDETTPA